MRCLAFGAAVTGMLLGGCSSSVDPGSGTSAWLRIQGAQYISGGIDTSPRDDQPDVVFPATLNNDLFPGVSNKSISGVVGPKSTAVLIGLQGDVGPMWAALGPVAGQTGGACHSRHCRRD